MLLYKEKKGMKFVTLTLSPAVDIEYRAAGDIAVGLNRTLGQSVSAGGKGINVSRSVLRCAEKDGRAVELKTVAPLGGETGELLASLLRKEGMDVSLIPENGKSLEINAPGTPIRDALSEIEAVVLEGIGPGDCVVIAGSCPKDVPKSYPSELVGKVKQTGAEAVLDCDGEALRIAVNAPVKPDVIKPNNEELAALTGCSPDDPRELARAAEGLGIPTVITTRAGEDPLLTDERGTISFSQEKRPVVRLKGAGDTFLGAFVYARYVWGDDDMAMEFASIVAGDYVAGK